MPGTERIIYRDGGMGSCRPLWAFRQKNEVDG